MTLLQRVEILFHDGTVEVVDGDDIGTTDGQLHVWNRHYHDGDGVGPDVPDVHLGSWPLTGIRRWRILEGG